MPGFSFLFRRVKQGLFDVPEMPEGHVIDEFLEAINDSYRVDETYIKVKSKWKYLYRAVDSQGNTIDQTVFQESLKILTYVNTPGNYG